LEADRWFQGTKLTENFRKPENKVSKPQVSGAFPPRNQSGYRRNGNGRGARLTPQGKTAAAAVAQAANNKNETTQFKPQCKIHEIYITFNISEFFKSNVYTPVADLEGAEPAPPPPPPLGDGLTPSLTVMLAKAKF